MKKQPEYFIYLIFVMMFVSIIACRGSNQTHSISINQTHSNQIHSNQIHSNQTHSNQIHSNQIHSNQTHSNQIHSNQTHSNQTHFINRNQNQSIANPAANRCVKDGYILEPVIKNGVSVEYLCVNPQTGFKCEIWKYFRHECKL